MPVKTPLLRIYVLLFPTDNEPFLDVFKVETEYEKYIHVPSKHSSVYRGYFPLFIQEVLIINIQPVSHWPHSTLNMKPALLPSRLQAYTTHGIHAFLL